MCSREAMFNEVMFLRTLGSPMMVKILDDILNLDEAARMNDAGNRSISALFVDTIPCGIGVGTKPGPRAPSVESFLKNVNTGVLLILFSNA